MNDTKRLNWLIAQGPPGACEGIGLNGEVWDAAMSHIEDGEGTDRTAVRLAIDTAMAMEGTE